MPKPFQEAFEEWKHDKSYQIGDDIGWEYADSKEVADPTSALSSSTTTNDHGSADSAQEVLSPR